MPATTRPPMARAAVGAAYYLGRPAAWWIAAVHGSRPAGPRLPAASGEAFSPESSTR
jgi:hypothetical protein